MSHGHKNHEPDWLPGQYRVVKEQPKIQGGATTYEGEGDARLCTCGTVQVRKGEDDEWTTPAIFDWDGKMLDLDFSFWTER